jgi:hypothetical protein
MCVVRRLLLPLVAALALSVPTVARADVKLILPLGRTAYQTNEWIDLAVVRSASTEAKPLTLTLAGADGSSVTATFTASNKTTHLHINGWLLRPGKYALTAAVEGDGEANTEIEIVSHVRQSSFRLINWGRAKGKEQLVQGEDGFGFNLFYGHGTGDDDANFLRAGVDFMGNCVMSGGHQMDLRTECDWSDPYVLKGGTRRVVRDAMKNRTRPNVPGVHFYDEPGLTWHTYGPTKEWTPHMIDAQVRSYISAFDRDPLSYEKVDPKKPEDVERWRQWATWKLGFMDAAWREARFGVERVRPDYLSVTQSQYGWSAFTDGYYFNVVRGLPVTSGHGGYHDFGPGFFNPSYFLEMARGRDFAKPNWYLPTWYGNTTSDQFRLEQYLSFQTNIQGMMSPPDLEPATNASARQGIVESNQLMKRLGPIFTTMPVTKPPVAMLYSLSQSIHTQTLDRSKNYAHEMPQGKNLPLTYLAGKLIQQQFLTVLDEDVLDGTFASDHKAVVLTSIDYLDPAVVKALEDFAAHGGLVLLTGDSTVQIKGAKKLDVKPAMPDQAAIDKLYAEKKYNEARPYLTTAKYVEGATPLAKALKAALARIYEISAVPAFRCDVPTIIGTRQGAGDIEYLFAVNATPDPDAKDGVTPKAVEAEIMRPYNSRPIYDALLGGEAPFKVSNQIDGRFRFGPGQMRVFAQTARPIGGVRVSTPTVTRELSRDQAPITLDVAATVVDDKGRVLSGSIPLHVRILDSLGVTRYELYRATKLGQFSITLPLAANDPPGEWKVIVRELLGNNEEVATFKYQPPARARSVTGQNHRAVYAANDLDNIFRFARTYQEVTIVKGTSAYNDAAAKRLAKVLEPWGVRCKEMPLTEASKSRKLTEEEAKTWCGLVYAGKGQIKPGDANPPSLVGFAVQGPVILLGTPEDNALIKFLLAEKFLPYTPNATTFPGLEKGMIAWQRDGVGAGQESVTLIAYDEKGMSEAVGSFYEAVAGIERLTKWRLPDSDALTPAKTAPGLHAAAKVAWTATLPDRVEAIGAAKDGLQVLTHDGSLTQVTPEGKVTETKALSAKEAGGLLKELAPTADAATADALKKQARPDRMAKLAAAGGGKVAVAYWGGTLRIVEGDAIKYEQQLPKDATALAWLGGKLIVGLADGRVLALEVK